MSGLHSKGTAARIRDYFQRNPTDSLTARDAAVKFDVPTMTAKSALKAERDAGRLVTITPGLFEPPRTGGDDAHHQVSHHMPATDGLRRR